MGCCLRKKLITVDKENADNFKDFSQYYHDISETFYIIGEVKKQKSNSYQGHLI